jgi:hypothetical protein
MIAAAAGAPILGALFAFVNPCLPGSLTTSIAFGVFRCFPVCRARFSVGRERANRLSVQRIPGCPDSLSAAVFACCSRRLLAALLVTTRFSKTASRVGTRHNPAPIDPIPQSCDFLSRSPRRAGRVRGLHGAGVGTLESGWFSRTTEDYFPLRDAR